MRWGSAIEMITARIREIAEFSELGPYFAIPVEIYSPGMAARLAFSVTTSITPEILVLDEWLGLVTAYPIGRACIGYLSLPDHDAKA